jgi:hypothetical protein
MFTSLPICSEEAAYTGIVEYELSNSGMEIEFEGLDSFFHLLLRIFIINDSNYQSSNHSQNIHIRFISNIGRFMLSLIN